MRQKAQLMDEAALGRALMRISHEITERNRGVENVVLVGIRRRGEPIAQRICDNIRRIEEREIPVGSIDIRYYRDDLSCENEQPAVRRTELPFDVTGRDVVLADDVIYTGRTVRAAIEAVFSCGSGDRGGLLLRQTADDPARGARGPRPPGAAHPARLCGQERPHLPRGAHRGPPARIRRRDRRLADGERGLTLNHGGCPLSPAALRPDSSPGGGAKSENRRHGRL